MAWTSHTSLPSPPSTRPIYGRYVHGRPCAKTGRLCLMDTPRTRKIRSEHRLLERGESVIASTGLAVAAILMLSLAAAGGWTVYLQRSEARVSAQNNLDLCGRLLAQTLEPLLGAS